MVSVSTTMTPCITIICITTTAAIFTISTTAVVAEVLTLHCSPSSMAPAQKWGVSQAQADKYLKYLEENRSLATAIILPVSIPLSTASVTGIVLAVSTPATTRLQKENFMEYEANSGIQYTPNVPNFFPPFSKCPHSQTHSTLVSFSRPKYA